MKRDKPKEPAPSAPPVATTGVDSGRRAVNNRQKKKKRYGFDDTQLNQSANTGFTAQDLDPRG